MIDILGHDDVRSEMNQDMMLRASISQDGQNTHVVPTDPTNRNGYSAIGTGSLSISVNCHASIALSRLLSLSLSRLVGEMYSLTIMSSIRPRRKDEAESVFRRASSLLDIPTVSMMSSFDVVIVVACFLSAIVDGMEIDEIFPSH